LAGYAQVAGVSLTYRSKRNNMSAHGVKMMGAGSRREKLTPFCPDVRASPNKLAKPPTRVATVSMVLPTTLSPATIWVSSRATESGVYCELCCSGLVKTVSDECRWTYEDSSFSAETDSIDQSLQYNYQDQHQQIQTYEERKTTYVGNQRDVDHNRHGRTYGTSDDRLSFAQASKIVVVVGSRVEVVTCGSGQGHGGPE
jgi:hypothetical protein